MAYDQLFPADPSQLEDILQSWFQLRLQKSLQEVMM